MGYIALLLGQLALFYGLPLLAGPGDEMGMVLLMLLGTWLLALLLGAFSGKRLRFFCPLLPPLLFLPSIYLFYNESAWVHALWYFVAALIGLDFGAGLRGLVKLAKEKKDRQGQ